MNGCIYMGMGMKCMHVYACICVCFYDCDCDCECICMFVSYMCIGHVEDEGSMYDHTLYGQWQGIGFINILFSKILKCL